MRNNISEMVSRFAGNIVHGSEQRFAKCCSCCLSYTMFTQKVVCELGQIFTESSSCLCQIHLINGCELLVCTPHSLLRMLKKNITSLERLCHMVSHTGFIHFLYMIEWVCRNTFHLKMKKSSWNIHLFYSSRKYKLKGQFTAVKEQMLSLLLIKSMYFHKEHVSEKQMYAVTNISICFVMGITDMRLNDFFSKAVIKNKNHLTLWKHMLTFWEENSEIFSLGVDMTHRHVQLTIGVALNVIYTCK